MDEQQRSGGCACGAVRYTVSGDPIFVNNCHCRLCQRQTGSTSVVNAFYESERIALLSGTLVEFETEAGSGGPHIIRRCADCGTAIMSHYPRLGRHGAGLRVGTLDDPASVTPDAVVFSASRMPWVSLPESVPVFEAAYDPRAILPAERFERLKALAGIAKRAGE